MSAAVQKYKRVLYSTSTVDEEYKDMLYSGSTDSTGSSTVVARSQTVLCGHSSARLLSTPSLYSAHRRRVVRSFRSFLRGRVFVRGLSSADEGALHLSWTTLYSTRRAEVMHNKSNPEYHVIRPGALSRAVHVQDSFP